MEAASSSGRGQQEQGFPAARADSSRMLSEQPGAPGDGSSSAGAQEGPEADADPDVRWGERLILELPPDAEREEVGITYACHMLRCLHRI